MVQSFERAFAKDATDVCFPCRPTFNFCSSNLNADPTHKLAIAFLLSLRLAIIVGRAQCNCKQVGHVAPFDNHFFEMAKLGAELRFD